MDAPPTDSTATETPDRDERHPSAGPFVRWTVAALSVAAAAIHLGFAPAHLDEDWAHGGFFLALGWFQLAWAALVVARPHRGVLALGAGVNLGVIGLWAVSRTSGLPFGVTEGAKEAVGTPDVLATIFEAAIVVLSVALLVRPTLADRPVRAPRAAFGAAAIIGLLAVVGASASITPRFAGSHAHTGSEEATGHHDAGHDGMAHTDDGGQADGHGAGVTPAAFDGDSPCEIARPVRPEDQVEDGKGHDHRGPTLQKPIDQATFEQLAAQQEQARLVVERFPTVADALADGYHMSTEYVPCIGAHYTKNSLVGRFDPAAPSELLYDGSAPTSKLVGLSYLVFNKGGPPDGFAGPNDVWHSHSSNGGLCMKDRVVVGGEQTTEEECASRGGKKQALKDIWMVHDWVVPGWECSWGVFAAECPELGGAYRAGPWAEPGRR
jgi:hypothetical protein